MLVVGTYKCIAILLCLHLAKAVIDAVIWELTRARRGLICYSIINHLGNPLDEIDRHEAYYVVTFLRNGIHIDGKR